MTTVCVLTEEQFKAIYGYIERQPMNQVEQLVNMLRNIPFTTIPEKLEEPKIAYEENTGS